MEPLGILKHSAQNPAMFGKQEAPKIHLAT